jgi:N-methylhydantoinase A
LTDANVVLGYINPAHLVGGALKLNPSKARSVIAETVARPLGMTVEEAAWGAHLIAGSNMIRAIKAVSSERGRDPRDYALVAFGGNGPLFAAVMAAALMIRRVVIPPSAGVFSSYGLLYSEVAYHFTKTRKALLAAIDPAEIGAILGELEGEARERLAEDGFAEDRIAIERAAALHYQGQSFELEVPVPSGMIDRAVLMALEEAYGIEHERTYGHRADTEEPVELVTLKLVGRGVPEVPRAALAATADLPEGVVIAEPSRRAYFGPVHGWCDTRVVNRADLGEPHQGPCIVEEYDSTCVVPPGSTASLDTFGNIVIDVPVAAAQ